MLVVDITTQRPDMEILRQAIERQVIGLTGLALGGIDYESPIGDPGLFGPDSVSWRVHGDFTSMLCGGISALLLQMLHPLALAGVWDHSNFRDDMLGRLRRTSQFIAATTFAPAADAQRMIERVRRIHLAVTGTASDGRPYAASDPDLLAWVHVAEARSFLAAHLRYRNPHLSADDQDRYYDEIARIAAALGARNVPRSRHAVADYLDAMQDQLVYNERTADVLDALLHAPAPSPLAKPFSALMMQAGIDLLPEWALDRAQLSMSAWRRRRIRQGVHATAVLLRWAVRNGSYHRAMRRMQRPLAG